MSTDLHDRTRQPPPDDGPDRPEKPKSSLSVAQVVGGALAAMTAAALGSRLSVAGTVLGAAVASVIAAVAGAVYTASLRRTSQHVSAVLTRVRPTGAPGTSPVAPSPDPSTSTWTDVGTAWALPAQPSTGVRAAAAQPQRSRIGWKKVAVAALLMFVVAALTLTGLELATGRALSGGTGTTVGQVADPGTRPSAAPTRHVTPTPSATPSDTPSAAPSATPSVVPSSEPSAPPSASATPEPSATPTPTPTATASSSAMPSGATPAS